MAALNTITREWADEIRDGIAWVIVWKTGRSWNAQAVWLNCDDDTFEPEDLELAYKVLGQDPNAVMLNGYYCGHFGEDMTLAELADGIRWHYENGCNLLDGSTAFPPEPMERPAGLPADLAWYGRPSNLEDLDPYVYDGYMSLEDLETLHKNMEADRRQQEAETCAASGTLYIDGERFARPIAELEIPYFSPPEPELPELRNPPTMDLTITLTPDTATNLPDKTTPQIVELRESAKSWVNEAAKALGKLAAGIGKATDEAVNNFVDAMLYNANDHPKWWHYYKHAKKWRVCKKYRRQLARQLHDKLLAVTAGMKRETYPL